MFTAPFSFLVPPAGGGFDPDAQAFFDAITTAGGSLTATEEDAINTLVLDLKGYSLWSMMYAIYPIVGSTSTTQKFNLVDPRDLDAAFRLSFNGGGWTHSSTGALPNGTTSWADTFLKASVVMTNFNTSFTTYLRTNSDGVYVDIGASNSGASRTALIYARYLDEAQADTGDYLISRIYASNTDSRGHYNITRTANNNLKLYKNGSEIGSSSATDNTALPSQENVAIAAYLEPNTPTGLPGQFSDRQVAFASIGQGMNATQALNFYNSIQTYQTTLGRQV